jgi:hypothetical protein
MKREVLDWTVEGSNWSWTGEFPHDTPPEEVATQVVEMLVRPNKWDDSFRDGLRLKDSRNPHVGMIMVVSHSAMKSQDEHLVVLSATIMANAGLHEKAKILEDASE